MPVGLCGEERNTARVAGEISARSRSTSNGASMVEASQPARSSATVRQSGAGQPTTAWSPGRISVSTSAASDSPAPVVTTTLSGPTPGSVAAIAARSSSDPPEGP